jgi:hypothetical protein
MFVGWLEVYPDYRTQGVCMDELRAYLLDFYNDVTSGEIPQVRRVGELSVA